MLRKGKACRTARLTSVTAAAVGRAGRWRGGRFCSSFNQAASLSEAAQLPGALDQVEYLFE